MSTVTISQVLQYVLLICAVVFVAGIVHRISVWRRGARGIPISVRGLSALPRRYMRDTHDIVIRKHFNAVMHAIVALGYLGTIAFATIRYLAGFDGMLIDVLLVVSLSALLAGGVLVGTRRIISSEARHNELSKGIWNAFPFVLVAFATSFLYLHCLASFGVGNPPSDALLVVAMVFFAVTSLWVMGAWSWLNPLRHSISGAFNLAFHPRPERFDGSPEATALRTPKLDDNDHGIGAIQEFAWNRLLNFDACVQCGRCESACPAFDAGQPLNPKALVQDLVREFAGSRSAGHYSGSGHPGGVPGNQGKKKSDTCGDIVGHAIAADTVWSCTTCRACVDECPMMVEHLDAIVDLRRYQTLERAAHPASVESYVSAIRMTGNSEGLPEEQRFAWAADLDLPRVSPDRPVDVLFWAGDSAFDLRGQRTLRAVWTLLRKANIDFAILGDDEADVGHTARRLGDEATFQKLARRNISLLDQFSFGSIVTADPHVLHCLKVEYRVFGRNYDIEHHSEFLARLLDSGDLRVNSERTSSRTVTFHDPCYLGRYNGEYAAPREVLQRAGLMIREMDRSARNSRCCGGGGGAQITDVPGARRIPDMRFDDALKTGADYLAVACPQCAVMLEGVTMQGPKIADIAELLLELAD